VDLLIFKRVMMPRLLTLSNVSVVFAAECVLPYFLKYVNMDY
jgi:hypothetical protein